MKLTINVSRGTKVTMFALILMLLVTLVSDNITISHALSVIMHYWYLIVFSIVLTGAKEFNN